MKFTRYEYFAVDLKVDTVWWASVKLAALAMLVSTAMVGLGLLGWLLMR